MRKKLIAVMILIVALSLLTLGIIEGQIFLITPFYEEMSEVEDFAVKHLPLILI
jgi:hypothetical protein